MFKIMLSPQYSETVLTLAKVGNSLTINGEEYDFSPLEEGGEVPPEAIDCDWIFGSIKKIDGIVNLTLRMPYNDADAPDHIRFPKPIMLIEDTEIIFNEKVQADD